MSEARRHFVYRALDEFGRLLYIGCTQYPTQRWKQHKVGSEWMKYATRFRMRGPFEHYTAFAIEATEIAAERPFFNAPPPKGRFIKHSDRMPAYMALRAEATLACSCHLDLGCALHDTAATA